MEPGAGAPHAGFRVGSTVLLTGEANMTEQAPSAGVSTPLPTPGAPALAVPSSAATAVPGSISEPGTIGAGASPKPGTIGAGSTPQPGTVAAAPVPDMAPSVSIVDRLRTRMKPVADALDALLASYSQVLFSRSKAVALLVLAATFVVPDIGAVGLLGVALANALALAMGLDRESVRGGLLGYNALLVFLMVGALLERSPAFWVMAAVLAAMTVLAHVALSTALRVHLRLPALSLPFVVVGWIALAAVPYVKGMGFVTRHAALSLGAFPGPPLFDTFLRSLGAIFFQPHWLAGALVFAALLLWSRIAAFHAGVGFAMAVLADTWLFAFPPDLLHLYIGFNFIVTAIALGGVFYVPGPASLLLAAGGSLAAGWLSVGLVQLLSPFGLPVLALPFNATMLVVLYAFGLRRLDARPRPVDFEPGSPEDNLNHFRTRVARFAQALPVRLLLPVRGRWVVTQGNDGAHTHQGPWRHGIDLEVAGSDGQRHRGKGKGLDDWHCYRLPVLSPGLGTVVRVVDGLPDNPVGQQDLENNWGNLVLIQHAPALFSMVAHLSPGSITVQEGAVVTAGQIIGKVGSSGRSPVPHLHVQLQATPSVGDPTVPLEFAGLVVQGRVEQAHLPAQDEAVRNLKRDEGLARALGLPVGLRLSLRVTAGGQTRTEELVSEVDLLGNRSLYSVTRDARLWFGDAGDSFIAYDHVGPRDGALFAWYAALARVPLDQAELTWTDRLNPRRLGTVSLGWLRDAAAALVPPSDEAMSYRSTRRGSDLVVTGESQGGRGRRAVRTEAVVRPGEGLRSLRVDVGGRSVQVELER